MEFPNIFYYFRDMGRSSDDEDQLYAMTIKGTAFLWHQVRCMVSLLFFIGQGLESPTVRKHILCFFNVYYVFFKYFIISLGIFCIEVNAFSYRPNIFFRF